MINEERTDSECKKHVVHGNMSHTKRVHTFGFVWTHFPNSQMRQHASCYDIEPYLKKKKKGFRLQC